MSQAPDYKENLSLMLSDVLHDIGVCEKIIQRKRRSGMLEQNMSNATKRLINDSYIKYSLGSRIEGTTTAQFKSDLDFLICKNDGNVMQDLSEWEWGKINLFMIQNETVSPGYCFLKRFRSDVPLPLTSFSWWIHDERGESPPLYFDNKVFPSKIFTRHGPSLFQQGRPGDIDIDNVFAFPCKSWPESVKEWIASQATGRWPTQKMKTYAASTCCFVVPTSSKVSEYPDREWRISTCLAERRLMFSLNITQIRCYILLKMILKYFLNPQGDINISTYMCKTVLFHTIKHTEPSEWIESHLFPCLTNCLLKLQNCVKNDECPHFILKENNLMAGQFTAETKQQLLTNISEFLKSDGKALQMLDIENLGPRLQDKMNLKPQGALTVPSCSKIHEDWFTDFHIRDAHEISYRCNAIAQKLHDKDIRTFKQYVTKLMATSKNCDIFKLLAPFLFTIIGSIIVSQRIGVNNPISPEALIWLTAGLNTDNSSNRLKLASVFYSTGDMKKCELYLRHIERHYRSYPVVPICGCRDSLYLKVQVIPEYERICSVQNEVCIKHITAFCVRFMRQEMNCIPKELQYEMFRSTQNDIIHRDKKLDYWMDWAVIDSLPFLFFLQYKTYGHLRKYDDQQQALSKLEVFTKTYRNLSHKETALNILGQCMEQEKKPQQALKCFTLSLQQRARNNVANVHICRLLSGIFANKR